MRDTYSTTCDLPGVVCEGCRDQLKFHGNSIEQSAAGEDCIRLTSVQLAATATLVDDEIGDPDTRSEEALWRSTTADLTSFVAKHRLTPIVLKVASTTADTERALEDNARGHGQLVRRSADLMPAGNTLRLSYAT